MPESEHQPATQPVAPLAPRLVASPTAPPPPRNSLLMWGVGQRLAAAAGLLLGLWLAVAWALGD